jgi:hypothetical protein
MAKKKKKEHLGKFDVGINEFGELTSTIKLEDINAFLDDNVADRKLAEKKEAEKKKTKKNG